MTSQIHIQSGSFQSTAKLILMALAILTFAGCGRKPAAEAKTRPEVVSSPVEKKVAAFVEKYLKHLAAKVSPERAHGSLATYYIVNTSDDTAATVDVLDVLADPDLFLMLPELKQLPPGKLESILSRRKEKGIGMSVKIHGVLTRRDDGKQTFYLRDGEKELKVAFKPFGDSNADMEEVKLFLQAPDDGTLRVVVRGSTMRVGGTLYFAAHQIFYEDVFAEIRRRDPSLQ